jgi:hypothetical protein
MNEKPENIITNYVNGEGLDDPNELSKNLIVLSAYFGVLGKEETEWDIKLAKKWEEIKPSCKTDKEADMKVKAEPEFAHLENTKSRRKMTLEIIRAIKKRLAVLSDEYKMS